VSYDPRSGIGEGNHRHSADEGAAMNVGTQGIETPFPVLERRGDIEFLCVSDPGEGGRAPCGNNQRMDDSVDHPTMLDDAIRVPLRLPRSI
jgi:hypothetical protein